MRLTKMIPPHEWAQQQQNMGVEPPAEANWGRLVQRRRQKKRQQQGQPLMPTQVELSRLRTEFEFPRLQQGQAVSSPRLFEFPPRPPIAKAGGGYAVGATAAGWAPATPGTERWRRAPPTQAATPLGPRPRPSSSPAATAPPPQPWLRPRSSSISAASGSKVAAVVEPAAGLKENIKIEVEDSDDDDPAPGIQEVVAEDYDARKTRMMKAGIDGWWRIPGHDDIDGERGRDPDNDRFASYSDWPNQGEVGFDGSYDKGTSHSHWDDEGAYSDSEADDDDKYLRDETAEDDEYWNMHRRLSVPQNVQAQEGRIVVSEDFRDAYSLNDLQQKSLNDASKRRPRTPPKRSDPPSDQDATFHGFHKRPWIQWFPQAPEEEPPQWKMPKKNTAIEAAPPLPVMPPPTVSAGVMCTRRRHDLAAAEVLAIRKNRNWYWEFPKGRRAFTAEQSIETAKRELAEETGICVADLGDGQQSSLVDFGTQSYSTKFEPYKRVTWYWLHLEVDVDDMFQNREWSTREVGWFTSSQLWDYRNKFKGGSSTQELAEQALGFARRRATISSSSS